MAANAVKIGKFAVRVVRLAVADERGYVPAIRQTTSLMQTRCTARDRASIGGKFAMRALLRPILDDDSITRHLGDAEARALVEWLVDRAELLAGHSSAGERIRFLCRRAKAIGLFVGLWCYRNQPGAAAQLANAEQLAWPLPEPGIDPDALMERILEYESRGVRAA